LVPAEPSATGPQADPQAAVRRDYELALQLATRDGWEAFLSQYPEGFYANLAKGQLKKIGAEEARIAAAEKAKSAEQEKARLAAEGARQDEIAKAAAVVRTAEEGQIAAEKTRQMEQEKAAAAEKARLAAQEKAAAAEQAPLVAERASEEKKQQVAAPDKPEQTVNDLSRSLQAELRRVGCNTDGVDGNWNAASQMALALFNKHAGMRLDTKSASADALDAVKTKAGRVCPLTCEAGYRADGDHCARIVCRSGYALTDEDTCEKIETNPVAKRKREAPARTVETPGSASAVARADAASNSGSYKPCMGALSGCYARAVQTMGPEHAKIWCSRRPTC
jgi:hypothetical protein